MQMYYIKAYIRNNKFHPAAKNKSMKVGCRRHTVKVPPITAQLTSVEPFYIDRRTRPHYLQSPRCLSPHHRLQPVPQFDYSLAVSPKGTEKRGEHSNRSCELSPQVRHRRINLQWDFTNTSIFKQKLKEMLKEYYDIQQKNQEHLTEKNRKDRQEQISKISKSFEELFKNNRRVYDQVKKYCQHPVIQQCKKLAKGHAKLFTDEDIGEQGQNFKSFIQIFTRKYIEDNKQNQANAITVGQIEEKIENLFHNSKKGHEFMNTMPLSHNVHSKSGQVEPMGHHTLTQFNKIHQKMTKQEIGTYMKDINKFIQQYKANKSRRDLKENGEVQQKEEQNESFQKEFQKILAEKSTPVGSGSQKFYKLIKQILVKSKEGKQKVNEGQNFSSQLENENISFRSTIKINKRNQKASTLNNTLSGWPKLMKRTPFTDSIKSSPAKDTKSLQQKFQSGIKIKSSLNGTKIVQKTKKKEAKKQTKKQQTKINKQAAEKRQKNKEEPEVQPKIQRSKRRFQKGVNYAKFINKMLKAAQSDRSSSHPEKFRYFKNTKTRQVFIRKKNKYIQDQQAAKQSDYLQKTDKDLQNTGRKSQEKDESLCSESEKKGRMTKYEQARLMYNMRNIRSRDIISTFGNTIGIFSDSHRKKRPSFYNLLAIQQSEGKARSKAGSFGRNREDEVQQEDLTRHISTRTCNPRKTQKSRWMPPGSSKFIHSQTQLQDLATFEDFDLRAVKTNITSYLRKFMFYNQKAKQLYNFLMYMEESRKITLEQQEVHSSLDQIKIQKEEDEIKKIVEQIEPVVEDYECCDNLFDNYEWNQKDLLMLNRRFIDKLDARSIQLMYWNSEEYAKTGEILEQCSLKQIKNLPL